MIYLLLGLLVWAASALTIAGTVFADFQDSFPAQAVRERRDDMGFAILLGCFGGITGPIGIFAVACVSGFWKHGWRLR